MKKLFVLIFLIGCGGAPTAATWTPQDTTATMHILKAQRTLVDFCSSDGGCNSGQVQVVEQATSCNLGAMMFRHGALDAGIDGCAP